MQKSPNKQNKCMANSTEIGLLYYITSIRTCLYDRMLRNIDSSAAAVDTSLYGMEMIISTPVIRNISEKHLAVLVVTVVVSRAILNCITVLTIHDVSYVNCT